MTNFYIKYLREKKKYVSNKLNLEMKEGIMPFILETLGAIM